MLYFCEESSFFHTSFNLFNWFEPKPIGKKKHSHAILPKLILFFLLWKDNLFFLIYIYKKITLFFFFSSEYTIVIIIIF